MALKRPRTKPKAKPLLSKQQEAALMRVYNAYWDNYIKGDVKAIVPLLDEHYTQVGSAESEVFFNKKDAVKFIAETIDQVAGKADLRHRVIRVEPHKEFILITEVNDLYVLIEGNWTFHSKFRASSLMRKKKHGWKFYHQHSSFPDIRAQAGENISIERVALENLQLRDAVKRRTVELEQKTRDLKVEATLERVRARAMAMRNSAELAETSAVLFQQINELGINAVRTGVGIFDDPNNAMEVWLTTVSESKEVVRILDYVNLRIHPVLENIIPARKAGKPYAVTVLKGNEVKQYYHTMTTYLSLPQQPTYNAEEFFYWFFFSHGAIHVITAHALSEEECAIMGRVAGVFGVIYTRFLDLQKAEAQTREAQIELALERVRARTMAMQHSGELAELVSTLFHELIQLGFSLTSCNIWIHHPETATNDLWVASSEAKLAQPLRITPFYQPFFQSIIEAWKANDPKWVFSLSGREKKEFQEAFFKDIPDLPAEIKSTMQGLEKLVFSASFNKLGAIEIVETEELTEEKFDILHRFGKVFELGYTRFNDLKKAEAQAREAQIETALERVRAKTMAMHKSEELSQVSALLYNELQRLGVTRFINCGYVEVDEAANVQHAWMTNADGSGLNAVRLPLTGDKVFDERYDSWKRKEDVFLQSVGGDLLKNHIEFGTQHYRATEIDQMVRTRFADPTIFYCSNFSHGYLHMITDAPLSEEEESLLIRFTRVFEMTYKRFLDLQKAEVQAREAQIEAALERVRSRSMAMHKSDELADVITVISEQLRHLNIRFDNVSFARNDGADYWIAVYGWPKPYRVKVPPIDNPTLTRITEARENGKSFHQDILTPAENKAWTRHVFAHNKLDFNDEIKAYMLNSGFARSVAIMPNIMLVIGNYLSKPYGEEVNQIIKRFAAVFDQAYTRFLDLQKAEAQAREAQIEAALERVRARTMAMHHSEELAEVVFKLFEQMHPLGLARWGFGLWMSDEADPGFTVWFSTPTDRILAEPYHVPLLDNPVIKIVAKTFSEQSAPCQIELRDDKKREFDLWLFENTGMGNFPEAVKENILSETYVQFSYCPMRYGLLQAIDIATIPDENVAILQRFAKVFEQTYTRFLDLQKAEAQAREAQIEAALERVRSRSMAMHKSEELLDVIRVIGDQMVGLGIKYDSASFVTIGQSHEYEYWFTAAGQSQPFHLKAPYLDNPIVENIRAAQSSGVSFHTDIIPVKENREYHEHLLAHGGLTFLSEKAKEKILNSGFARSVALTPHIMLAVGNYASVPFTEAQNAVIGRFGAVFEQSYTRFLDLQKAEAQAREAKIEASLEKVRSRSLAMHKSDELHEVIKSVLQSLDELGIVMDAATINTVSKDGEMVTAWIAAKDFEYIQSFHATWPLKSKISKDHREAYLTGADYFANTYTQEEKNEYLTELFANSDFRNIPDERKAYLLSLPTYALSAAGTRNSWIQVVSYSGKMLSPHEAEVLKRFARVFEQCHVRFQDLEKAEAQAREAQIEAALERVRSSMMAMHQSDGLPEVMKVIAEQLIHLGIPMDAVTFSPMDNEKDLMFWTATTERTYPIQLVAPYVDHPIFNNIYEAKSNNVEFITYSLTTEETKAWWHHFFTNTNAGPLVPEQRKKYILQTKGYSTSMALRKNSTLNLVNYAGIPFSEEENGILRRFANVFDQAYTRFLDIQKAEAQAREAEIQLALERVRARAMAMHHSDELKEVASVMREQFSLLGQPQLETVAIHIYPDEGDTFTSWFAVRPPDSPGKIETYTTSFSKSATQLAREMLSRYQSKSGEYIINAKGQSMQEWLVMLFEALPSLKQVWGDAVPEEQYWYFSDFSAGSFVLIPREEPSKESKDLLKRSASVFDLAYRRYADLKKAEAQAREAEIQLALERVRARTMAMYRSEELREVVFEMFNQMHPLGLGKWGCGVALADEAVTEFNTFFSSPTDRVPPDGYRVPIKGSPVMEEFWLTYKNQSPSRLIELAHEKKRTFDTWLLKETDFKRLPDAAKEGILSMPYVQFSLTSMRYGLLEAIDVEPIPDEKVKVLERFAKVFEQTYTRFLDLQKAEFQAREAQIEASLERVRSRAMAIRKSDELVQIIKIIFQELRRLDFDVVECSIVIYDVDTKDLIYWSDGPHGAALPSSVRIQYMDHPIMVELLNDFEAGIPYRSGEYSGELLKTWWDRVFSETEYKHAPKDFIESWKQIKRVFYSQAAMNHGFLEFLGDAPLPEEKVQILRRFTNVVDLTYTRHMDVVKAEAQAREAHLEAVLERVRSSALAMQKPGDMLEVCRVISDQLQLLDVKDLRNVQTLVINEEKFEYVNYQYFTIYDKNSVEVIDYRLHPVESGLAEKMLTSAEAFWSKTFEGEELENWRNHRKKTNQLPDPKLDEVTSAYYYFFSIGAGALGVTAYSPLAEDELNTFRRFRNVFELAYKRYKDLEDAEARAQLAVREASLDRVRAEIASMRHADDLQRITPLIWRELQTLGVPFFRCGVLIVNEHDQKADYYLSTPEGKPLAALHLDFNTKIRVVQDALEHWRQQKVFIDHWDKEQFVSFARSMMELGQIQTMKSYQGGDQPPESITLQFIPFAQGMLYVGSTDALSADQIRLVHALADAFSTAYARYEDFTRLEAAKAIVERTLSELRTTQTQLVQSEKMASLGELTAGIAHEIQNPLNFVNNFSEVSKELLDEMEEELKKGNAADAKQIARNVIENLEKITFHGKRADGIVKSMLQHSRKSTGQKELTDINALCDEYLRLSYHGLRAKDKSFNAKFEADLDPNVGQVLVMPQEIGRVVLNLINNAFYAVSEKKKLNLDKYESTVTVTTKKIGNNVEIRVKDNGTGIPQKVVDKIFNPFFTTKPTGQGTGLGLSLSYDIITKGHGGELKVITQEGEGSEFIVQLPAT